MSNDSVSRRQGQTRRVQLVRLMPGVVLAALVAWLGIESSAWIGVHLLGFEKSPISGIMMAIIFGLLIRNLIPLPSVTQAGIRFSLKHLLKLGIILLGIRLSLGDIVAVGVVGLPVIIFCMAGAVIFARWLSRRLDLSERLGTLIAIGTSVCGATAIVATGPAIEAEEEELAYAVANITIFGIIAMFLYPFLAHWLFSDNSLAAGLLLGTSIHETAQVAGSGLIYAQIFGTDQVLDVATVTKLVRNVFMIVLIPLMVYLYQTDTAGQREKSKIRLWRLFPTFILGFLLFAILRTVGDATLQNGAAYGIWDAERWSLLTHRIRDAAEALLAIAMAAVGLGTGLRQLAKIGIKPFYVGFAAALSVLGLSVSMLLVFQWIGVL